MLRSTRLVTVAQFKLLRRDKIFVPGVITAVVVSWLAYYASDWSVENFRKVLYDIGYFGFHVMGCMIALFWGVKTINDSRQEGSIEFELAAPISRQSWLVGKYAGLAACLFVFGVVLTLIWQGWSLLFGVGLMTPPQLRLFLFMVLDWLVVGALAVFCASFLRQAVALFVALMIWVIGLATSPIAQTLAADAPEATKAIVHGVTRVWDLQQFNLIDEVMSSGPAEVAELWIRAAYGGLLILSLMTVACLIFRRRDVIG